MLFMLDFYHVSLYLIFFFLPNYTQMYIWIWFLYLFPSKGLFLASALLVLDLMHLHYTLVPCDLEEFRISECLAWYFLNNP